MYKNMYVPRFSDTQQRHVGRPTHNNKIKSKCIFVPSDNGPGAHVHVYRENARPSSSYSDRWSFQYQMQILNIIREYSRSQRCMKVLKNIIIIIITKREHSVRSIWINVYFHVENCYIIYNIIGTIMEFLHAKIK